VLWGRWGDRLAELMLAGFLSKPSTLLCMGLGLPLNWSTKGTRDASEYLSLDDQTGRPTPQRPQTETRTYNGRRGNPFGAISSPRGRRGGGLPLSGGDCARVAIPKPEADCSLDVQSTTTGSAVAGWRTPLVLLSLFHIETTSPFPINVDVCDLHRGMIVGDVLESLSRDVL